MFENTYELQPRFDSAKSFYGKALVEVNPNGTQTLYSYNTRVAHTNTNGTLSVDLIYSQTTARHIREFMKQLGFNVPKPLNREGVYNELGKKID